MLIGLAFPMNKPFRNSVFKNSNFTMLIGTLGMIYNMTIPISWVILGSNLVTFVDIIAIYAQIFTIMLFIGIAFMYLIRTSIRNITIQYCQYLYFQSAVGYICK